MDCDVNFHRKTLDSSIEHLMDLLTDCVWTNLKSTSGTTGSQSSRKHTIRGWNEHCKAFQSEAQFWRECWKSSGSPIYSKIPGVQHDLYIYMKRSHNNFHYAVRRTQKIKKELKMTFL